MPVKKAIYEIADFKAVGDPTSGEFEAIVSVFNNVDMQGDRVNKGAFTKSLAQWKASGDPIPIVWSHDWQDPFAHIGYATSAVETDMGLLLKGKNDVNKPFAAQVHDLLVSRRVKNWSFAYDVINEHRAKDGANELDELGLIEAGPTLRGANSSTDTINAKSLLEEAAAKEVAAEHQPGRATEADPNDFGHGLVIAGNNTTSTSAGVLFIDSKAGRRLSQATQDEMQSIHDDLTALQERMRTLMGTASEEPKTAEDADTKTTDGADARDAEPIEPETEHDDDREPPAKSLDQNLLRIRTRIEEMRANTGKAE